MPRCFTRMEKAVSEMEVIILCDWYIWISSTGCMERMRDSQVFCILSKMLLWRWEKTMFGSPPFQNVAPHGHRWSMMSIMIVYGHGDNDGEGSFCALMMTPIVNRWLTHFPGDGVEYNAWCWPGGSQSNQPWEEGGALQKLHKTIYFLFYFRFPSWSCQGCWKTNF